MNPTLRNKLVGAIVGGSGAITIAAVMLGNPTLRYSAMPRSDTKYGFTAAIPNIQLNIWNGDTVQLPSRYLIATVAELDSQLWTVNSIKPNSDNTVSLTVAEYSDSVYE